MARMLDALNQVSPVAAAPLSSGDPQAQEETVEIPFIEVGPFRSVEASPGVLLSPVEPRPVSSAPAKVEAPGMAPLPRVEVPVSVPFQPVQPAPTVSSPAPVVTFRPVPGRAPRLRSRLAAELVAYHAPGQPVSAPYADLFAALAASNTPLSRAHVLFFTSGRSEVGTTTVLLNVAITAAQQGHKVLVVDANLRRPGIAAKLGLGEVPGLREVLSGLVSIEQAVQPTEQAGLFALTSGPLPGPARLTVSPDTVARLLEGCGQVYDFVLVDGSRWDGRPDVTAFGSVCAAVYLVVPGSEAETPAIQALMQLIPEQGGRLAGSILTSF